MSKKLLAFDELRPKGVPFSKPHLNKEIRNGRFPRPIKLGGNTNAWIESEVDAWIEARIADRDSAVARPRDEKGRIQSGRGS